MTTDLQTTDAADQGLESGYEEPRGTIFLAEDDGAMRALLAMAMTRAGFRVLEARNGIELLDRIESELGDRDTLGAGNVIVSDVKMGRLGGFGVLETLQQAGCDAPCILITAFGDEETHARARELGADALFDKPFAIKTLLDRVRDVLDHQRTAADGLRGAPAGTR